MYKWAVHMCERDRPYGTLATCDQQTVSSRDRSGANEMDAHESQVPH